MIVTADVVVIGGGIIGGSVAYDLGPVALDRFGAGRLSAEANMF